MTTWTVDQIRRISALRQDAEVDTAALLQTEARGIRERLARALTKAAHPYAVELHPDDIQLHTEPDANQPWLTRATVGWRPKTHQVELTGGPMDGALIELRDVDERIPFLVPVDSFDPALEDLDPTSLDGAPHLQYRLAGWRETERRWVYAMQPAPRDTHT